MKPLHEKFPDSYCKRSGGTVDGSTLYEYDLNCTNCLRDQMCWLSSLGL